MAKFKLLLPRMGESVAEATIIKWNKNIGDLIEIDDAVIDIATDKVDSEVPSPVKGRLVLQLCKTDEVVQVGSVLGIIETEEATAFTPEQTKAIETYTPFKNDESVNEAVIIPETEQIIEEEILSEETDEDDDNAAILTDINENGHDEEILPDVAPESIPGVEQLNNLPKPEVQNFGSRFYSPLVRNIAHTEGITGAELDTIPGTGADGRLTKDDILLYLQNRSKAAAKPAATVVPPTTPVSSSAAPSPRPSEALEQPKFVAPIAPPPVVPKVEPPVAPTLTPPPVSPLPPPIVPQPPKPVTAAAPAPQPEPPKAAPAASASEQPKTSTPPPVAKSTGGSDVIIEMDRMRRLIADHMVASVHTSPHVTSFVEADVTNLVIWREKIKAAFEKREGTKITFMPIFIEAVAKAIKDYPMINVSVNGTQIIKKKDINIGMAAALPSGNLIVPVIRKADELNLIGLSHAVNDLANRARTSKLVPDEIREGTFTITNVGSFGNDMGTPIINQPQVAILAVGAIKKKPAVIETETGDAIAIRHMMFLSLSYDHRVVDGALGGSFIRRVADYLEKWDLDREV